MIGLGELPPELILQIIEQLEKLYIGSFDCFSLLRNHFLRHLIYLNRNWFQASCQYLSYSAISLKDLQVSQLLQFYENDFIEELPTRYLFLRLPNPPWQTAEKACSIMRRCKNLKSIILEGMNVEECFSFSKDLRALHLKRCTITDNQILEINKDSLLELGLEEMYLPQPLILKRFSNLQILSLKNSSISFLLFLKEFPDLKKLDISGTAVDVPALENLSKYCPLLQSLGLADLRWSKRHADELADMLVSFNALESLNISNNTCGFSALLLMESLPYTKLLIGSNVFMSEGPCRMLFNNLADLQYLEFSQSCFLSDINLNSIVKRCPKLSTLILPTPASLPNLQLISSFSLMRLPTILNSLERFEARGCQLTYDVVTAFAKHCRYLRTLILDRFVNTIPFVNYECIELLLSNCDLLIHLSLTGIKFDLSGLQVKFYRTKISWK